MNNGMDREFYIFGEPLETKYGKIRFLTYKEYLLNLSDLSVISYNVLHFYYEFRKSVNKNDKDAMQALEELKNASLYTIIVSTPSFLQSYVNIFKLIFENEEMIDAALQNEEEFNTFRKVIMDMNLLKEDEVSPNPEIQEGIEISRNMNSDKGNKQSFIDIVTSIVANTSFTFEDVGKMNVFQVYSIYSRIGAIFNYNTSTLFATVSEQTIESWSKHIDLFEGESSGSLKRSEFDKKFGKLL